MLIGGLWGLKPDAVGFWLQYGGSGVVSAPGGSGYRAEVRAICCRFRDVVDGEGGCCGEVKGCEVVKGAYCRGLPCLLVGGVVMIGV